MREKYEAKKGTSGEPKVRKPRALKEAKQKNEGGDVRTFFKKTEDGSGQGDQAKEPARKPGNEVTISMIV